MLCGGFLMLVMCNILPSALYNATFNLVPHWLCSWFLPIQGAMCEACLTVLSSLCKVWPPEVCLLCRAGGRTFHWQEIPRMGTWWWKQEGFFPVSFYSLKFLFRCCTGWKLPLCLFDDTCDIRKWGEKIPLMYHCTRQPFTRSWSLLRGTFGPFWCDIFKWILQYFFVGLTKCLLYFSHSGER